MAIRATITHVNAALSVTYVKPEADAYINNQSKNQWFYEDTLLSEITVLAITKELDETITAVEEFNKHLTLPKTESPISLLESFLKVVTYDRHINDTFTLDDASLIDKDYYGNKGNIATLLEVMGISYNKPFTTDTYTVSDVVNLVTTYIRQNNETLTLTETYAMGTSFEKSEDAQVTEVHTLHPNLIRSESLSTTETYNFTFVKNILDTFTLIDHESAPLGTNILNTRILNSGNSYFNLTQGNEQVDTFSATDLPQVGAGKVFADTLSQLPSAFSDYDIFNLVKGINEPLPLLDALSLASSFLHTDAFTMADLAGKGIYKNFTDGFAVDDAALIDKNYYGNKGNLVSFSDILSVTSEFHRQFNDAPVLTDIAGTHLNKILQGVDDQTNIHDIIDIRRITGGVLGMLPLNRVNLN